MSVVVDHLMGAATRDDAAFACLPNKFKQLPRLRTEVGPVGSFQRLVYVEPTAIKQFERSPDFIPLSASKACASQPNMIHAEARISFARKEEWRDVLAEGGVPLTHRQPADVAELMESARSAEEGAIIYPDVTAEETIVRDNDVVPKLAVVSYVHTDHEEVLPPNDGRAVVRGAAMNRAMLANDVAFSNLHPASHLRFECEILGRPADDRTMSDQIPRAKPHASFEDGMGLNRAVVSNHDLGSHEDVGTNFHPLAELGSRFHDRCRMNAHSTPASLKLK
jgi:hypothetical protein